MATFNISVSYRPLRIGFLVREGQISDIVEAAKLNTLLSGGIYNPIIPVSNNDALVRQLFSLFSVDVIYPVVDSPELKNVLAKFEFLREDHYFNNDFFIQGFKSNYQCKYFDCKNIIQYYWDTEYKNKPEDFKSNFTLVSWENNDPLSQLFPICFGQYPDAHNLKSDFEASYKKGLYATTLIIPNSEPIPSQLNKSTYPILFTSAEIKAINRPFRDYGIYLGSEEDFIDLFYFWNLRASGINLEFLPLNHSKRYAEFAGAYLEALDNIPNKSPNFDDFITVYHHNREDKTIKEILRNFRIKKGVVFSNCHEVIWNGLNIKPATLFYEWNNILANVERKNERYNVVLQLPKNKLVSNHSRGLSSQLLVASVRPLTEFEYPSYTLKPPNVFELTRAYGREVHFRPFNVRLQKDGIGVIIDAEENTLWLNPISYLTLIQKIFELLNINSEISQAGLITMKILEKVGDVDGGRIFKVYGVRELLQKLSTDDCFTKGQIKSTIWNNDQFRAYENLFIEPRENAKLSNDDVFNFLLRKEFLRAGLELVCGNCRLKNWLSLKEIDDFWNCNYCGSSNQTSVHLNDRGDWKFRKSGLFAKDNNQEGAIPVILTLIQFLRVLDYGNFVYTPSLKLNFDQKECEIDFCIINYTRGENIELGIGECKSIGGRVDQNDIDNFLAVHDKFKSSKIDCFLIFSKTAEEFTTEEISLFHNLTQKKIPIILFTNKDLEPYHPYWERDDKNIPSKYAHTMWEMHKNSVYTYLKN